MTAESPDTSETPLVTYQDFTRLDLRVARVVRVEPHPKADRLYLLTLELGSATPEEGAGAEERRIVAGIRPYYAPEELEGRSIVIVANLEPATIRGVESRGMLLAVQDGDRVSLLAPDSEITPGSRVS